MSTPTPTTGDSPSGTASSTPSCTTAVPGKYGEVPPDACNSQWAFHPDFGSNLAWAVLMGVTTLVHLIQAVHYKKKFCWVLLMGSSWETLSFALRAAGSRDQQQLAYNVVSQIILLLAPLWLNAFVYMTVSRLIYYVHADQKVMRIRAVILTRVFVWLDVVCFIIQAGGGSLLSGDSDKLMSIGKNVYIAGIALQQAIIVVFSILTAQFFRELPEKGRPDRPVTLTWWLLIVIFANFALITVRIIFRLVEFIPGANHNNPLLTNEVYVFCLDALPVLIGLVLLNVLHPGRVLRGPDSEFPTFSRAEKKEMKRQKKEAKKDAKMQKRMAKKVGRDVWVEVDTEEVSLDNVRYDRWENQGGESSGRHDQYENQDSEGSGRYDGYDSRHGGGGGRYDGYGSQYGEGSGRYDGYESQSFGGDGSARV